MEISPIILALCACTTVCGGLFFLVALSLLRRGGVAAIPAVINLLTNLLGGGREDRELEEEERPRRRARTIPSSEDLRSKAQSLDFDAAVQQYRQQQGNPITPPSTNPPPSGIEDDDLDARLPRDSRASRMRNWKRRNEDEAEDELLGGLDVLDDE